MRAFSITLCVILAVILAFNASASGYVVVLKNGEHIRCREPLAIEGHLAILTLKTGQVTSYPVDQIDLIETERYNKLGVGDAYIIEELTREDDVPPTPTPRLTLGSYAEITAENVNPELGTKTEPTPVPTPGIKLYDRGFKDERVDAAFLEVFDKHSLYLYRTSVGTQPDYFFVQVVTDSQREVFHALKTVAKAYTLIMNADPTAAPAAVELKMLETSGKPAGTFRLTYEDARILVAGETTPEKFYVENVIF